jgi:TRAP-type C4-dicarboxylate transport system substrate-binding protein
VFRGEWVRQGGIIFAAAILCGLAAHPVRAEDIVLRLHHFLPANSTSHEKFLKPWAEGIATQSKGRLRIEIHPAMRLGGKPHQLYDQAATGAADLVWTLPGYTAGRFPIAELFELPFLAGSAEATSQAVQEFGQKYLKNEFKEVRPLALHVYHPGALHTARKQVKTLEDLRGLKIRAPTRILTEAIKALGAQPVSLPLNDLREALDKGTLDGAALPFEILGALRLEEALRFHTSFGSEPGIFSAVFLLAMNKAKYESLPADLRQVIDANSGRSLSRRAGAVWDQAEALGEEAAKDHGNEFYVMPKSELLIWRAAAMSVTDQWVSDMDAKGLDGEKMLAEAQALIAKYEKLRLSSRPGAK